MRHLPAAAGLWLAATLLAACSSTQEVLEPSAIAPQPPAAALAPPEPGATAAIAVPARIRFDPLVGATPQSAKPLTDRLAVRLKERGIGLAGNTDPATTHVLKGYFSALTENNQTTIVYVWDVYDAAGARLHRLAGQQRIAGGGGWAAVTPATMEAIADQTVGQLGAWLARKPG